MLTNLPQQINNQADTSLLNEMPVTEACSAVPVCDKANNNQLRENVNLPGVYAQLPHHCIQLCFLS